MLIKKKRTKENQTNRDTNTKHYFPEYKHNDILKLKLKHIPWPQDYELAHEAHLPTLLYYVEEHQWPFQPEK